MEISEIFEYIERLNNGNAREVVLDVNGLIKELDEISVMLFSNIPEHVQNSIVVFCNNNKDEVNEELEEFINEFNSDSNKLLDDIRLQLKDYAMYEGVCSNCGYEIEISSYLEEREYFGAECNENFTEGFCVNCGEVNYE